MAQACPLAQKVGSWSALVLHSSDELAELSQWNAIMINIIVTTLLLEKE